MLGYKEDEPEARMDRKQMNDVDVGIMLAVITAILLAFWSQS